ncbi:MAG: bifunctional 3-(3-hydroxy-phenyl)propionate/3-hydroxycinnamic acid hydroxylase [Burkholderiaceae bacterium]
MTQTAAIEPQQRISAPTVDVAVIGYGPTGAALAHLLGQLGLSVRVIERNIGVLAIPRAVHLDGESMRILQSMGLASRALSVLRPGANMEWVNATGQTLLVRTSEPGLGPHGWHNDYYFHQPDLERLLRWGVAQLDGVQVDEGWALQQLRQDGDGVALDLTSTDGSATSTLRASYVVGCDGARSTVRGLIAADEFEDLGDHQTWLVVDGLLHHPLKLPEHTVQHCDPARPSTSIYVHPLRRRWELMLMPGEDADAMLVPELVWRLLQRWVKPAQATLERAAAYTFHSLIARRWQQGRVMLAGDAVHQTPPFLGQGLCTGLRDAANLAWKLALAVAEPALAESTLASYGSERLPHARAFVALAVEVGRVIQVIDPAAAAERDTRLQQQGLRFAFPMPALGPGLHRARVHAQAVGRIAPQFELEDGRWSDDVCGPHWSLWLDPSVLANLTPTQLALLHAMALRPLAATTAAQRWLQDQSCGAALLRPDRYVCDIWPNADAMMAGLAQALPEGLPPPWRQRPVPGPT